MMIYVVNRRTKEHRTSYPGLHEGTPEQRLAEWTFVRADEDGWIKHDGASIPIIDQPHEALLRDGRIVKNVRRWYHYSRGTSCGDVVAYRPILEDKERDMDTPVTTPSYEIMWAGRRVTATPVGEHNGETILAFHSVVSDCYIYMAQSMVDVVSGGPVENMENEDACSRSTCSDERPNRTVAQRAEDAIFSASGIRVRDGGRQASRDIYTAIREGRIPGVKQGE